MPHVVAACSSCLPYTDGLAEFDIEADNVRRMIAAIDRRFPGLGAHIDRRMAIAIDGEIHQDAGEAALSPASEVYLIPRIGGG